MGLQAPPPSAQPGEAERSYWVFADNVVVRSQPSPSLPKVGSLNYGDQVQVVGRPSHGFVNIGPSRNAARRFFTDRKARFNRAATSLPAH